MHLSRQTSSSRPGSRSDTRPGSRSKLSDSQRSKIENIKMREEKKGDRRNVLEQVLLKKLVKKYGNSNEEFIKVIKTLVNKLVNSSARIGESDIAALELTIKNKSIQHTAPRGVSTSNSRALSMQQQVAKTKKEMEAVNTRQQSETEVLKGTNEWVLIDTLKSVEYEESELEKKSKIRKEKERQRRWLDAQRQEKREKAQKEKQDQLVFYKQQVEDLKKWQADEEKKVETAIREVHVIKTVRDKQLSELKQNAEVQMQQRRKEEEAEVERIKKYLKEEEEEVARKRDEERERMRQVLLENKKVEIVKAQRKVKEQDEDIKLMEEYARKLAKEEQDRIDALESKLRRQDEIHSGMAMSTHEMLRKKAEEDERRAEDYQRRKQEADALREKNDTLRRKKEAQERKEFLDYQLKLKAEEQKELYAEEQEYAAKFRKEGEDSILLKKQVEERNRKKNKEYEKLLLRQMEEQNKHKQRVFASMDEKERKLNAKLLDKLSDEQVQTKVSKKLSPEKKAGPRGQSKTLKSNIF